MYFSTYEAAKTAMAVRRSEHAPVQTAVAGALATVVNDALMTPGDVIKQRLQLANSPYRGILDCALQTYRREGLRAFYRSYQTTVRALSRATASAACNRPCCLQRRHRSFLTLATSRSRAVGRSRPRSLQRHREWQPWT